MYLLKTKDEDSVLETFKNWKALVENQTNRRLKVVRTDNGLELCNKDFNDNCAKNGITRHRTCSDTPQQNGIVERMNKTILEHSSTKWNC